MLRGFLIKLMALDSQLEDNYGSSRRTCERRNALTAAGETTFAVIVETDDDLEPTTNKPTDGVRCSTSVGIGADAQSIPPWIPALSADTLRPSQADVPVPNEPLLSVKAVETGVIDVRWAAEVCSR